MARFDPPWGAGPAPGAVAWVPHALSLCGLACGFMSLLATTSHDFAYAAAFVIAAIFFDGFDGAAARALHVEGPFGETMDSLADLVAFGIAPGFLIYQSGLTPFGTAGAFAAAIFAGCGAIRLARFPLVKRRGYFVGLPIPMAGAFVAMLAVYASEVPPLLLPLLTLGTAALMVSTIPFPYFATAFGWLPGPARWALVLSMAPLLFVLNSKTILFFTALYLALGPAGLVRIALEGTDRPLQPPPGPLR